MSVIVYTANSGGKYVMHDEANGWRLSHAGALVLISQEPDWGWITRHPGAVREVFVYAPGTWNAVTRGLPQYDAEAHSRAYP